jgi:hypothetical protein
MEILPDNILTHMAAKDRKSLGKAGMTREESITAMEIRSERDLQNQIASYLYHKRIWFHRTRMDKKTTGPVGTPDFIFAVNGRPIAWEVKLPGKELSFDQASVMAEMFGNSWCCATVRSVAEAKHLLDGLLQSKHISI